jgi:pyridoxine 5'-phosphate synthase PdxJ
MALLSVNVDHKEYSIGHSIIARAVMVGLDQAIREMIKLVSQF